MTLQTTPILTVLGKDLHQQRGYLLAWWTIDLIRIFQPMWLMHTLGQFPRGNILLHPGNDQAILVVVEMVLMFVVVFRLVQGDSPTRQGAHWRLLPISPGQMLGAKLLFLALCGWLIPVLLGTTGLLISGFNSAGETVTAIVCFSVQQACLIAGIFTFLLLFRNILNALFVLFAGCIGVVIVNALFTHLLANDFLSGLSEGNRADAVLAAGFPLLLLVWKRLYQGWPAALGGAVVAVGFLALATTALFFPASALDWQAFFSESRNAPEKSPIRLRSEFSGGTLAGSSRDALKSYSFNIDVESDQHLVPALIWARARSKGLSVRTVGDVDFPSKPSVSIFLKLRELTCISPPSFNAMHEWENGRKLMITLLRASSPVGREQAFDWEADMMFRLGEVVEAASLPLEEGAFARSRSRQLRLGQIKNVFSDQLLLQTVMKEPLVMRSFSPRITSAPQFILVNEQLREAIPGQRQNGQSMLVSTLRILGEKWNFPMYRGEKAMTEKEQQDWLANARLVWIETREIARTQCTVSGNYQPTTKTP